MTLFDDNNPYSDSSTTTLTEQQPDNATEHSEQESAAQAQPEAQRQSEPEVHAENQNNEEQKPADDFAAALESFTTETEEATGEDHVIHGTVLKLTPTHVFVDIGAKSEGALPIAEVQDHEG